MKVERNSCTEFTEIARRRRRILQSTYVRKHVSHTSRACNIFGYARVHNAVSACICPCASASCTICNTSQAVAPGAKATTSKRNHGGQHQTHQNGQSAAFVSPALTVINQSRGSAMERRRPHLRSSGAWSVYNLVPDFVQTALRCTWSCVWHAASSLGLGPPPSE